MAEKEGAQLATGWLELVVSTEGAQKSMTSEMIGHGEKAGSAGGQSLGSALLAGVRRFAGPLAILAGGFSIGKLVKDSTEQFEGLVAQTNQLQRIAGGTAQQVSGMVGAMQLSGITADKSSGALTIFAKNLGNAANDGAKTTAMNQLLGGSFKDATGQIKPMAEILPGLADKFQAMPDGAAKAALATSLFGRSGAQLLPFLNKGSAGIADLTAQATKMGLVIDDVSQKTFADAKTSTRSYQGAIQGLMVTLGGNLVPILDGVQNIYRNALTPIFTAFTGLLQRHRQAFIDVGGALSSFSETVGGKVTGGLSVLGGVFTTVYNAVKPLVTAVGAALGPLFAQLGPVFKSLLPQLLALASAFSPVQLIFKALAPVLPQIITMIGTLAASLGKTLGKALGILLPPITKVAGLLASSLTKVIIMLLPIITQLANMFAKNLAKEMAVLAPIIAKIAGVLGGILTTTIKQLMPIISMIATTFGQVLKALMPLVPALMPLVQAVLSLIAPLLSLIGPILTPLISLFNAILKPILALITPLLNLLVPVLVVIVTNLTNWINVIAKVIQVFVDLITGSKNTGKDLQALWGAIGKYFAGVWNGVVSLFTKGGQQIWDFFAGLGKTVLGAMVGADKWLFDIGKNMIQGLINGAGTLLKNIGSFFLKIIPSWIVAPFKAALGIHSPSTVFAALGGNVVDGFIVGLTAGRPAVGAAMSSLVSVPTGTALTSSTASSLSASSLFPKTVTLVDADGSLLGHMAVVANAVVGAHDDGTAQGINGGINR